MSVRNPPIFVNIPSSTPTPDGFFDGSSLGISARPGTDLWRKPPLHEVSNMPSYLFEVPVSSFRRARVTVTAQWQRQYDQGGLVLFLPAWPARTAWVKAGIEYYMGKPCLSVVAAQSAADWSLRPGAERMTLEIERETIDAQTSLWVYVIEGDVRTPVREVTWMFASEDEAEGMMSIGIYAARPTTQAGHDVEELSVTFDGWDLEAR